MRPTQEILRSKMSINDCQMDSKQLITAEQAMFDYAKRQIDEFVRKQNKVELKSIGSFFWSLFVGDIMLWKRKKAFLRAKNKADKLAVIENRPFYVIRQSETSYVVQSTLVARNLKKRGVYHKNVTSIILHETADYVSTPTRCK